MSSLNREHVRSDVFLIVTTCLKHFPVLGEEQCSLQAWGLFSASMMCIFGILMYFVLEDDDTVKYFAAPEFTR